MALCMQRSRPRMRLVSRDSYEGTKKRREFHGGTGLKVRPLCFPFSFFLHFSFLFFLLSRLARLLPGKCQRGAWKNIFLPVSAATTGKTFPASFAFSSPRSFSPSSPGSRSFCFPSSRSARLYSRRTSVLDRQKR